MSSRQSNLIQTLIAIATVILSIGGALMANSYANGNRDARIAAAEAAVTTISAKVDRIAEDTAFIRGKLANGGSRP